MGKINWFWVVADADNVLSTIISNGFNYLRVKIGLMS